ncbi:MAG: glycoside hydrolase [Bacteroidales bacterium]
MAYIAIIFSLPINAQIALSYTIHVDKPEQVIDNFGASDCWVMARFGKYGKEDKINMVSDWLFSKELDETGKPKGIGLSMWRMNFGGGSDDNPFGAFRSIHMRTPCIMKKNGTYDLSLEGKCGGQFKMLQNAKERGCEYTLGFVNSPPYFMTRNGETTGNYTPEYELKLNLSDENIPLFADYMTEVIRLTKEKYGITFDYIDPVNEPEWEADMGENNHANNYDIKRISTALNESLINKGISTRIIIPEAGAPEFIYMDREVPTGVEAVDYGKKAENFFGNSDSPSYVGDLETVERVVAAHAYWISWLDGPIVNARKPIPNVLRQTDTRYWQTEWCLLEDAYDEFVRDKKVDTSINFGLYTARLIHCDLSIANASAWHWWLGLSDGDYKDGLLHLRYNNSYNVTDFLNPSNPNGSVPTSKYKEIYENVEAVDTKLLWCFGNYSRFIRPNAQRLQISSLLGVDQLTGVMASSYRNDDGQMVVVMINYSKTDKKVKLRISDNTKANFTPYITSDLPSDNLRPLSTVSTEEEVILSARSITTFVQNDLSTDLDKDEVTRVKTYVENGILKIDNAKGANLYLYSSNGSLVNQQIINENKYAISSLPSGLYISVIALDGDRINDKIYITK